MRRASYQRRVARWLRCRSPRACWGFVLPFIMVVAGGVWIMVIQPLQMWSERMNLVVRSEAAQSASASQAEKTLHELEVKLARVRSEIEAIPLWSEQSLEDRFREMMSRSLSQTGGELLSVELKAKAGASSVLEARAASDYSTMLAVLEMVRTAGMPLLIERHAVSFESSVSKRGGLLFTLSVELQPFAAPPSNCLP